MLGPPLHDNTMATRILFMARFFSAIACEERVMACVRVARFSEFSDRDHPAKRQAFHRKMIDSIQWVLWKTTVVVMIFCERFSCAYFDVCVRILSLRFRFENMWIHWKKVWINISYLINFVTTKFFPVARNIIWLFFRAKSQMNF